MMHNGADFYFPCRTSKDIPDRTGKAAAASAAASAAPLEQLPAGELARKLADSQQMIARFSRENERLANQNEQLTGSKQIVANDYKGACVCFWAVRYISRLLVKSMPKDVVFSFFSFCVLLL